MMSNGKNPLMLMMAMTVPGAAHALGLGDIHVTSNLNERLSADIDIVGATSIELNGLRATVANRDAFTRYGFDHPAFLSSITFKVGADAQGHPVLALRSAESFNEPVVNLLVDVHWGNGQLVRQYTLLLDPAEFGTAVLPSAASRVSTVSRAAQTEAQPAAQADTPAGLVSAVVATTPTAEPTTTESPLAEAPMAEAPMAQTRTDAAAAPEAVVAGARAMTHIKVGPRATLRGIAWRIGERSESDLQRMMIAIFRANPSAFEGNINLLHLGAVLTIPADEQIESISRAEAKEEVHAQMAQWRAAAPARAARLAARAAASAHAASAPAASVPATLVPAASSAVASIPAATSVPAATGESPAAAPAASAVQASVTDPEGNEALNHRIQSLEEELRDMKGTLDQERDQLAAMQAYATRLEQTRAAAAAQPRAAAPAAAGAPTSDAQPQHSSVLPILGGLGLLGAALAGIYAKFRRRPEDTSDAGPGLEAVRQSAPAQAAPISARPAVAPAGSYEVVETMPLRALSADGALDATTKLEELGFENVSLEDSQRVQSILEGSGDDPTHRLPSLDEATQRLTALAGTSPASQTMNARTEQTVRLQGGAGMSSEQSRSDLHISDVDLTSQHHVHMPSALNENSGFKERRTNLADVLRKSLDREPDRDDLRMKLLELYYSNAATNQQGFLEMVQKFANERGSIQDEQWEKIAAMGRQIAAENPMFTAEPSADAGKKDDAAPQGGDLAKIA